MMNERVMNTMNLGTSGVVPISFKSQNISDKVFQALSCIYVNEKCTRLVKILNESIYKELHSVYPYLIQNIFGFGINQPGWGLIKISKIEKPYDYIAIQDFLCSNGPLLNAASRLLSEGRALYEFPVSCLPLETRQKFDEGNIPPLYAHKVPYSGPGSSVPNIMLNAIEYFYFHFAYYIVNPTHSKDAVFANGGADALYPCLLQEYLNYLLPLDGTAVPVTHFSKTATIQPQFRPSFYPSPGQNHFNSQYENISTYSPNYPVLTKNLTSTPLPGIPINQSLHYSSDIGQEEIWRSQTLTFILVEFWLNLSNREASAAFNTVLQEIFVPSQAQMQLVRLFVKHIHFFVNSAVTTAETIENISIHSQSVLEEFKRNVISQHVKKKMYHFLKLSFERWPMDSSFRLLLETWLSYIQPWRYDKSYNLSLQTSGIKDSRPVEEKWKQFVAENLLFYTLVFQKVLPRFFRMELTFPRNSFMLLRLTKVFSQPNLQDMIVEAETRLQEPTMQFSKQLYQATGMAQIRQYINDLEGFGYNYQPMFGPHVRAKVLNLLQLVCQAKNKACNSEKELSSCKKGWFHSFLDAFTLGENRKDELSLLEQKKVQTHLELVCQHLCSMFKLSMPLMSEMVAPAKNINFSTSTMDKKSYKEVKYRGNPDLQPIRSFEVAFLVRLLYFISTQINEKYQNEINALYYLNDWKGSVCRQLLASPTVCQNGSEMVVLPPRLSLRVLANIQLLAYLFLLYLGCYYLNYGLTSFLTIIMLLVLAYTVIGALLQPRTIHSP